ncbi:MAG: glycosyltransferase [Christensenellales bacterium]|nr:glycosyltransferase [Christensenellales bacterium]
MRYYREINDFFREHGHEYDIIWDNECMFNDMTPLKKAAEVGIPVRIAHCHNPQNMDKSVIGHVQGFLHRVNQHSLSRYANVLWACSMESAKWACPAMDLPCEVIPNAIDAQMFRFSEQVRREVREQYGLEDCLVVGHVGRLQYQKNQTFLLDAFRHLHEREEKARLVLVGDGPDLTELEAKAVTLGIEREVLFLGNRDDVNRLLQAFDLFVMPSHFEGFGMAALEAQAAGLPCLLSASVPRETKLTRNVEFIPAEDPAIWAEHMLNMLERHEIRRDEAQTIADAGYDIGTAAQRLEDKLIALTERKRFQRRFLMTPKTSASGVPALNKARADIEQIAAEMGYAPFVLHAPDSANGSVWQAIQVGAKTLGDWVRAFYRMRQGDLLLVQYPYFPVKGYGVARLALHLLRWKGVKTAALVHDLDSLRRIGGSAARGSDQLLLPGFEALIVHSQRMESYLRTVGVTCPMILMEAFDCLSEGEIPVREKSRMVAIAGNLAADKSGYLKDIGKVPLEWQLYGTNWARSGSTRIEYHGEIAPEKLPETISGAFGIVWDGDSLDGLTGLYGAYALLNSPHKLSTYLAGGLPVIVAKNAATADFVAREQVGVALNSLRELPELIRTMPEEDYQRYAANARRVGAQLRAGENTKRALRKLEEVE